MFRAQTAWRVPSDPSKMIQNDPNDPVEKPPISSSLPTYSCSWKWTLAMSAATLVEGAGIVLAGMHLVATPGRQRHTRLRTDP